jgi:hypothetical protein
MIRDSLVRNSGFEMPDKHMGELPGASYATTQSKFSLPVSSMVSEPEVWLDILVLLRPSRVHLVLIGFI